MVNNYSCGDDIARWQPQPHHLTPSIWMGALLSFSERTSFSFLLILNLRLSFFSSQETNWIPPVISLGLTEIESVCIAQLRSCKSVWVTKSPIWSILIHYLYSYTSLPVNNTFRLMQKWTRLILFFPKTMKFELHNWKLYSSLATCYLNFQNSS